MFASDVLADEPSTVCHQPLSWYVYWGSFIQYSFIELFAFRLVKVHHNDPAFRGTSRGEVFLNEGFLRDGQSIWIFRSAVPVLCESEPHLCAAVKKSQVSGFLGDVF